MDNIKMPFRFAIMGAGNIANKFCDAVALLEGCQVVAVASKSYDRAENFAKKHGITGFYDSYEKMLTAEKPDCVYIAACTDAHYELTMLCLEHSVPVLCEKAMFMNSEHAKQAFEIVNTEARPQRGLTGEKEKIQGRWQWRIKGCRKTGTSPYMI